MKKLTIALIPLLVLSLVVGSMSCGKEEAVEAGFSASPTSGAAPLEVQFTDQSTGEITGWEWDFDNDGTVDSTEQSPSHIYETAGKYTVSLKVTGRDGSDTAIKANCIRVGGAGFSASPVSGPAPLEVQFTDQFRGGITAWEWDFDNDGTVDSTVQNPSHTYDTVGQYTVSLKVTGPEGWDIETKVDYIGVGEPGVAPTGTLTIAVTGLLTYGYPSGALQQWVRQKYDSALSDHLTYLNSDASILGPGLAESWEISDDNLTCTFYLREGVQFHDGWGELTAEDVKYTVELFTTPPASGAPGLEDYLLPYLDEIEVVGPYEVAFHYNQPRAEELPWQFANWRGWNVAIQCKAYYEEVGWGEAFLHPIMSGPYRFVEELENQRIVYEAVDSHWRVVPEYKQLIFKEVPEEAIRVGMLMAGDVDIAEIAPTSVEPLVGEGFDIVTVPSGSTMTFSLGGQLLPEKEQYDPTCPIVDIRVREALNLAINREEIAEFLYSGYAEPAAVPFVFPWSDEYELCPYDPDRAIELLADAGYPDGFELPMWVMTYPGQAAEISVVTEAVAGYWEAIGLTCPIIIASVVEFAVKLIMRDNIGVSQGWANIILYPPDQCYRDCFTSGYTPCHMYENAYMDERLDMIDTVALTLEERNELAREMTQHIYDEYAMVPLVTTDVPWAVDPETVGNWVTNFGWPFMLKWEYIQHPTPIDTFRLFEP